MTDLANFGFIVEEFLLDSSTYVFNWVMLRVMPLQPFTRVIFPGDIFSPSQRHDLYSYCIVSLRLQHFFHSQFVLQNPIVFLSFGPCLILLNSGAPQG